MSLIPELKGKIFQILVFSRKLNQLNIADENKV